MSAYRLEVRAPPWFPAPPPALAVDEGAGLVLGWRYSAHPPLGRAPRPAAHGVGGVAEAGGGAQQQYHGGRHPSQDRHLH